jgi:hypothetical protein
LLWTARRATFSRKTPLKEGEIIDLMRHLPESKKGDVIAILKALTA